MSKLLVVDPSHEVHDIIVQLNNEFGDAPVRIAVGEGRFMWPAHTEDERASSIEAALMRSGCGQITVSPLDSEPAM